MAYKPILAPEEFHAWLQQRAERLDRSMAAILREIPEIIDAVPEGQMAGDTVVYIPVSGKLHRVRQGKRVQP